MKSLPLKGGVIKILRAPILPHPPGIKRKAQMSQFVIYAHSGEPERIHQIATMAASAAANGDEVHVILFFGALERFVDDDLGAPLQAHEGARGAHSAEELIEAARRLGKLKVYACAAQPKLLGLAPEEVADVVDEIISLPEFMRKTHGAETKLFI